MLPFFCWFYSFRALGWKGVPVLVLLSYTGAVDSISGAGAPLAAFPNFQGRTTRITLRVSRFSIRRLRQLLGIGPGVTIRGCEHCRTFRSRNAQRLPTLLTCAKVIFGEIRPRSFSRRSFYCTRSRLELASFYCKLLHPLSVVQPCQLRKSMQLPRPNGEAVFSC